jgi:GntR family transcriptional repressor for pyruvate dehydrogenase complex
MAKSVFKKIYHFRKSDIIVNQIYEAILRGDLKSNERFSSEKELAATFGVSKLTAREAIRFLEQSGIFEVRKGGQGGIYIRELNLESISCQIENIIRIPHITVFHLNDARRIIEKSFILEVLPKKTIPESAVRELQENIQNAERYYADGNHPERLKTNFEFHAILARLTENPLLIIIQRVLEGRLLQFFEAVKPSPKMGRGTLDYHQKILDAIRARDFTRAATLSSEHIAKTADMIVEKSKRQSPLKERQQVNLLSRR